MPFVHGTWSQSNRIYCSIWHGNTLWFRPMVIAGRLRRKLRRPRTVNLPWRTKIEGLSGSWYAPRQLSWRQKCGNKRIRYAVFINPHHQASARSWLAACIDSRLESLPHPHLGRSEKALEAYSVTMCQLFGGSACSNRWRYYSSPGALPHADYIPNHRTAHEHRVLCMRIRSYASNFFLNRYDSCKEALKKSLWYTITQYSLVFSFLFRKSLVWPNSTKLCQLWMLDSTANDGITKSFYLALGPLHRALRVA